ncbi:methyl-accepting chemotaxis protein [Cupriavidus alkaliphilus]|uniref:methyl-accepting chemotaxis protein n=1 Tax=Cupriavidus alkaliphilus TaxID=942866 RepID=UPI000DE73436|nr:methyl-accepting chemotaxis protein [Cupriavidus alkaliphilus]PVY81798.1 methyl-accepting chemotaxis protein [Cupriavidus alkaliphilus]
MTSADHALSGRLSATIPARRAAGGSVSTPAAKHTPLLQGVHRRADRLMTAMLWLLGLLSLVVGNHYGSTGLTLALGLPIALLGTLMAVALPARLATRLAMAVLIMAFVALLIHQARGQVEFHFLVFVSLSMLLAYRDFRVILLAALVIALHHLSFNFFQQWGWNTICFTDPSFNMVVFHAAFVIAQTAVLCVIAWRLERDAHSTDELSALAAGIGREPGYLTLAGDGTEPDSDFARAFRKTLDTVRQTLQQVRDTAGTVADAAGEILDTSASVAHRTEAQARIVAQTMHDMQALTQSARASADQARGACELAGASSAVVARGSGEILSVIQTMGEIDEACGRITEIIGVIDSIAFQTNILALNAAVEAARAGEHGKGFAVVAGEVRQLAHRCGAAAREIRGLINTSVERAHAGTELVGHTGETMNEVVASIGKLAALVQELATLGDHQRSGIEGMAQRVAEIQAAFEENAELVAGAAEAARAQRVQTEGLNRAVGVFRLD